MHMYPSGEYSRLKTPPCAAAADNAWSQEVTGFIDE